MESKRVFFVAHIDCCCLYCRMNSFWTSFWGATVQSRFVFVERITNQPMTFEDNTLPNSHDAFLEHGDWLEDYTFL